MKKTLTFIFLGLVISLFLVSSAQAAAGCPTGGLVPCGGIGCPCTLCHFTIMFRNIIDFVVFRIVPLLAVLLVMIGGFMYIIAFINPSEGGSEALNRAKSLFKSVVVGLFIIYGAWLIINLFFMVIGVNSWTGLEGGWWKIECETSVQSSSSGGTSGGNNSGSASASSTPTINQTDIAKVTSVNGRIVSGDELAVDVAFQNPTNVTREYRLYVYDASGNEITHDPYYHWVNVEPGQSHTLSVSTDWNSHWDTTNLGGAYRVELREYSGGTVFQQTNNIPSQ